MKAQMMTLTALLIFLLMFAELFTFALINIQYNRISENTAPQQSAASLASAIGAGTTQFGQVSAQTATALLAYYLYNSTLANGNTLSTINMANDVNYLITNGMFPGAPTGSVMGNYMARGMGALTLKSYDALLLSNFTYSGLTAVNQTQLTVTQPNNYTLAISYIENLVITQPSGVSIYSLPISFTTSLNSTIYGHLTAKHYVPITLQNTQTSATPSPFQQMIKVNSQTYTGSINPGWGNVEFSTGPGGSGTVLQSWVEANPSNTVTNTVVWVKLPNGIPASSNVIIYMDFMPVSVVSSSGPAGEAPQLTSTYAQYDNGALVFSNYWNFAGTSTPSGLTTLLGTGSVTVSNGLTLVGGSGAGSSDAGVKTTGSLTPPLYADYYGSYTWSSSCSWASMDFELSPITSGSSEPGSGTGVEVQNGAGCGPSNYGYLLNYNGGTANAGSSPPLPSSYPTTMAANVFSLGLGSNNFYFLIGYVSAGSVTGDSSTTPTNPLVLVAGGNEASQFPSGTTGYWLRTRGYPPNNVMPSPSFGTLV